MILIDTENPSNRIAIAYDAADVTGLSTEADFKTALEALLGLNTKVRAQFYS
jgi:hypothetical protein